MLARWLAEQARLERRIEKAEHEIQESKHRLDRISIAIEEYTAISGAVPASRARRAASGDRVDEMVYAILQAEPQRAFDGREMAEAMVRAGWASATSDPVGLMANYMSRLKRAGRAFRHSKGRYAATLPRNGDGPHSEVGAIG